MIVARARLFSQQIAANVCRTFATDKVETKYWYAALPDGKPRSFDEMPILEETKFDPYKQHEVYPQWFKKYGYVLRQPVGKDVYIVHTCHFDDIDTVIKGDRIYRRATRKIPERLSHLVLKDYREKNKERYDNIGLGPGHGDYVDRIRGMIRESMSTGIDTKMEENADDLMEIVREKVGEGGDVELLPWLFRWGFENVGLKFLDKRLGALSGNEEADKMVEAAATTNEMVALTTMDPFTNYEERYKAVEASEGYFYSVLRRYIEEIASEPDSKCAVKKMLESSPKDAITVTLDGFQGALQTVPLTVLMALYNLARNKEIQAQARRDVMEYLPTKESKYCAASTYHPEIIDYIMWETLRYSPPIIGLGRIIKNDMVLGGYNVPKETNVIMHVQVASRLPEFYENPLKFDPNRFKTTSNERVMRTFGTGSLRACIGSRFATDAMSLILLKMLRNFEFSYEGEEVELINRLHNEPKYPLLLKMKPLPE